MLTKSVLFLMAVLAVTVWSFWFFLSPGSAFTHVAENWEVSVTMIFGSLIAGSTSEGGGAVAFPVFTKLLHINPHHAKVFSLAIQSVGMTAAALVILAMRVKVEWRAILWVSIGGMPGVIFGSALIAPLLPPEVIKMSFTALAASLAITLFAMNRIPRERHLTIPCTQGNEHLYLLAFGILGGILSGLVGNGIDILAFSLMVLLFRLSEKVATPTSVIIMAINALFGFLFHYFILHDFPAPVRSYWLAAVPFVVVGAPLGAVLCSFLTRHMIARFLIFLIAVEVITSLLIIPLTGPVVLITLATLSLYTVIYALMYRNRTYERVPLTVNDNVWEKGT